MERLKLHHIALLIPVVCCNNFNIFRLKFSAKSVLLKYQTELVIELSVLKHCFFHLSPFCNQRVLLPEL